MVHSNVRQLRKHGNWSAWMHTELVTELRHRKEVHRRWKEGEAMWDEYRLCMKECGEEKQLALYCLQKAMETRGGFND